MGGSGLCLSVEVLIRFHAEQENITDKYLLTVQLILYYRFRYYILEKYNRNIMISIDKVGFDQGLKRRFKLKSFLDQIRLSR